MSLVLKSLRDRESSIKSSIAYAEKSILEKEAELSEVQKLIAEQEKILQDLAALQTNQELNNLINKKDFDHEE